MAALFPALIAGLLARVRVVFGDFFAQDLGNADVVTCYLLQDTNNKLEGESRQKLRPGTRVVSNTFTFRKLRRVRQNAQAHLYL